MITINVTAEERIIEILESNGPCSLDDVVRFLHPHLSWSDVFVAVDRMSRDGRLLLRQLGYSTYQISRRSARMPRSEERRGMAARSEAEAHSLLVYKNHAWKGGVLYLSRSHDDPAKWGQYQMGLGATKTRRGTDYVEDPIGKKEARITTVESFIQQDPRIRRR